MDLKVTIKPTASWRHALELRQGRLVKEVPFTAAEAGALVFDPMKCSRHITLSGGNKLALSSIGSVANGMTTKGYTEGKHCWAVQLPRSNEYVSDFVGVGCIVCTRIWRLFNRRRLLQPAPSTLLVGPWWFAL